jgi:RNA polymerase sigma factor (sigma-70 family)
VVVDDDETSRNLIVELLGRAGFECVAAERGENALALVAAERPWIVVLEVRLPDIGGFELCRQLRDMFGEDVGIVFISADKTEPIDRAAGLLVGGDDYLSKPLDPTELLARVRRLSERLRRVEAESSVGQPTDTLTAREREVLRLLALGRTQREIAKQLGISDKTVSSHLQRVLEKLRVHSRAHAVAIAYQDGLVRPEDTVTEPIGVASV